MQLVFRRQAELELLEAALTQALRMPLAYSRIEDEFRHVMTRKFPYSLIYAVEGEEMVVISCFHHSRRPGSGKSFVAN